MNRFRIFCILLLLVSGNLPAQVIMYTDKDFRPTRKGRAVYFRFTEKTDSGYLATYRVKKKNTLVRTCLFNDAACKQDDINGCDIRYYPGNTAQHAIKSISRYENGIREGASTEFLKDGRVRIQNLYHNGKLNGPCTVYYPEFGTTVVRNFLNDSLHGKETLYHPNGVVKRIIHYTNNRRDGAYGYYDSSGRVLEEGQYTNNEKTGYWNSYHKNRNLAAKIQYQTGSAPNRTHYYYSEDGKQGAMLTLQEVKITGRILFTPGKVAPLTACPDSLSRRPMFPGGDGAFTTFIMKNLVYPDQAIDDEIEGSLMLLFDVDEHGLLDNFRVQNLYGSYHPLLAEAAISCLRKSPAWIPGTVCGIATRKTHVIPLAFHLN